MLRVIANVGPLGQMGLRGQLIKRNPLDLQLFRLLTTMFGGSTLFAGRRTAEGMSRVILPGRQCFYVTRNIATAENLGNWKPCHERFMLAHSDGWLIGGASMLHAFANKCDEAIIMRDTAMPLTAEADAIWLPEASGFSVKKLVFEHEGLQVYRYKHDRVI